MGIIGFNYKKFDCVKEDNKAVGQIEVKHNVSVIDVRKESLSVGSNKNDILKIIFNFDVLYGNSIGKINTCGEIIYSDTKEIVDETLKQWESEKKLNVTVNQVVVKFIYNKVTIRVLDFADLLNLPAPIPMPKINFEKK